MKSSVLLEIPLTLKSKIPLYEQLYQGILKLIQKERIVVGDKLPSSRGLARDLGISRPTIELVYRHLVKEGYLERRHGSGTYISEGIPKDLRLSRKSIPSRTSFLKYGSTISLFDYEKAPVPFRPCLPAFDEFPLLEWIKIQRDVATRASAKTLGYAHPQGTQILRKIIAEHLAPNRGIYCDPNEIVITSGTQNSLYLLARCFDVGEGICYEDPGYLAGRQALAAGGLKICPLPIDDEGIEIDRAFKLFPSNKLAFVSPSYQFPLGVTMPLSRRMELIRWAVRTSGYIFEDDYAHEIRYSSLPSPSLKSLDRHNRVIYLGTFSKSLFPAVRLGYIIAPAAIIQRVLEHKSANERQTATLIELAVAKFIDSGAYAKHVRRMRKLYRDRQEFLFDQVKKYLGTDIVQELPPAGLHLLARTPSKEMTEKIVARGKKGGLELVSTYDYSMQWTSRIPGLVLGYTSYSERALRAAVHVLASAWEGTMQQPI